MQGLRSRTAKIRRTMQAVIGKGRKVASARARWTVATWVGR